MLRKRKAISPVVAIVILIAVAVALGIAVAFWATGLIGTLGQIEKLEVRTAYASSMSSNSSFWEITLKGANTGTSDVTIVEVTINGKPINDVGGDVVYNSKYYSSSISIPISSGSSFTLKVHIPVYDSNTGTGYTSGQTVEVALISGSGTTFKRTVVLP